MYLLESLLLVRLCRPESHHQFPMNCGYSDSLTLQYHCWTLWNFCCQCPHHLGLPHSQWLCIHIHPHLPHWSHCHPGRWTCCLCCPYHRIWLVVLARWSGSHGWMLSWSGTLQCWSQGMKFQGRSWLANDEPLSQQVRSLYRGWVHYSLLCHTCVPAYRTRGWWPGCGCPVGDPHLLQLPKNGAHIALGHKQT